MKGFLDGLKTTVMTIGLFGAIATPTMWGARIDADVQAAKSRIKHFEREFPLLHRICIGQLLMEQKRGLKVNPKDCEVDDDQP